MDVKVSLVGAGSASFGLETIRDIASSEELHGCTVALIDVDEERLKVMTRVAERLNEHFKADLKIESYMSSGEGLEGSDFVIISVEKERMKRWWLDYKIPHKHGIRQVIGECGGPGGLSHTLRVVRIVLDICHDAEDQCPDALIMNYSNPEARVAYAISRYTRLKVVGLCPGIYGRMTYLSEALGSQIEAYAAGLNHFTWILKMWFKDSGEDAYPVLMEKLRSKDEALMREPLSRLLCLTYGYYPSPSDGHVGEYISYAWNLVSEEERGENWLRKVEEWSGRIRKTVMDIASGRIPIGDYVSSELIRGERGQAINIIRAMISNRRYLEYSVNIPNDDLIADLPSDTIVEVPAVIDAAGIHPIHIGKLPDGIDALCYTQAVIQRLSAEAAHEGSYEKALQALLLDPVVHDEEAARKTLNELLEAQARFSPNSKDKRHLLWYALKLKILNEDDIRLIHEASLSILEDIGIKVPDDEILRALKDLGCNVNHEVSIIKIPREITEEMIKRAAKKFTLYSRDGGDINFGDGSFKIISSGGMMNVIDPLANERRPATRSDMEKAIKLGDALENIDIVGPLFVPQDVPADLADIHMHAALIKYTSKPFLAWIYSARSARYILKMWMAVTGEDCGRRPLSIGFFEPISPLRFSRHTLQILKIFAKHRIPACFGPMVMAGATGPATLAGTLTLENAEILSGIVMAEALGLGTPILYGGIPHILDQRTGNISFGSPEQGLMAAAITQIGQYYGFPVHVNVGLTDSKSIDFQSGAEKSATMIMGALAGAELSGHQGIIGADVGGSLEQLLLDDEIAGYVKRILRGFKVEEETIALNVIREVNIGGNFLTRRHTLRHIRGEFWLPRIFDRLSWEDWKAKKSPNKIEETRRLISQILERHEPKPLDPSIKHEIEDIIEEAKRELKSKGRI